MKRTIRRQMTRLIIPALVALLVSGPAWAEKTTYIVCPFIYYEFGPHRDPTGGLSLKFKLVETTFGGHKVYKWKSKTRFSFENDYLLVKSKVTSDIIEFWDEVWMVYGQNTSGPPTLIERHKINRVTGRHEKWLGEKKHTDRVGQIGHNPFCETHTPKF